jgi:acyl-[acyl-carrier-protein]-phospholipid O-acyltransferase/long-chain-fatty-acid--[acyl-carrier-protein] ligase
MKKSEQQTPIRLNWSLGEQFVRSARQHWRRRCMADVSGKTLSYSHALPAAIALSDRLEKIIGDGSMVGILMPPSCGGALANIAVTLLGKVTVNLNYSLGVDIVKSAITQSDLKVIITSRKFVEKLEEFKDLPGLVYLEDIASRIGTFDKIKAFIEARFLPGRILARTKKRGGDDPAAIIFSSGSSGEPKGVMLSHKNILSNIHSLLDFFLLYPNDNICGVLPFFHVFGFTVSLWLPISFGASVGYVANPLSASEVARVAAANKSTILFAAPTFLITYSRRVDKAAFVNLRAVLAGAEKLRSWVADSFEDKFGLRPMEGYGMTELSPVVSLNLTEAHGTGKYPVGNKEGTAGRPIPDVQVKIVSLDDGSVVATGKAGLLYVKGPNVMLGYLNNEAETAKVLQDGWYNTGDIARLDEDGFIIIEDRLSRFSKISGEMVPHTRIEEIFHQALGTEEHVVAVTGVPHPKKGEELVVLHVEEAGDAEKLQDIAQNSDIPNLWKPARDCYIKIKSIPLLGSGKLDLKRIKEIAQSARDHFKNK